MQRFKIHAKEGVGLIRAAGPLTLEGMRQMRAEVLRLAMRSEVERVLCDLSAAVVMLDAVDWQIFTLECCSQHAVSVPTGYLVQGAPTEAASRLCDQLNRVGRIALSFTTSQSAYRWLGVPALRLAGCPEAAAQD